MDGTVSQLLQDLFQIFLVLRGGGEVLRAIFSFDFEGMGESVDSVGLVGWFLFS